jgi:hypothetical protein
MFDEPTVRTHRISKVPTFCQFAAIAERARLCRTPELLTASPLQCHRIAGAVEPLPAVLHALKPVRVRLQRRPS